MLANPQVGGEVACSPHGLGGIGKIKQPTKPKFEMGRSDTSAVEKAAGLGVVCPEINALALQVALALPCNLWPVGPARCHL